MFWERGFLEGTARGRDIYDAYTVGGKKNVVEIGESHAQGVSTSSRFRLIEVVRV
jgi:hypothetical protein